MIWIDHVFSHKSKVTEWSETESPYILAEKYSLAYLSQQGLDCRPQNEHYLLGIYIFFFHKKDHVGKDNGISLKH